MRFSPVLVGMGCVAAAATMVSVAPAVAMPVVARSVVMQTPTTSLRAQVPTQPAQPHVARVTLRVRPAIGDTLRMRMDQTYEMYSEGADSLAVPPITATVDVCTRAIVLHTSKSGTELLTITDSVDIQPAAAANMRMFQEMKRALDGRSARIHMANDGGIRVLNDNDDGRDAEQARALVAQMPPMLPPEPVAVGQSWTRDIPIPLSATSDEMGSVRATFRLDSLGPDQAIAYVSMHGTFSHARAHTSSAAPADSTEGTIDGTLQVDRRLSWLTDSRTTVSLTSVVWAKKRTTPMRVHLRITQWLRAVPAS